jgi:hypothetical protein
MKKSIFAFVFAIAATPFAASAVSLTTGSLSGTGTLATFPDDGTRASEIFTVPTGFEALLGVSITADSTGEFDEFAQPLVDLEYGLSDDPNADVSMTFSSFTDFFNPASAADKLSTVTVTESMPFFLIAELPAGIADGDEILISYAYSAELRPVSPVNPIPVPPSAALALGGFGLMALLRRRKRIA